MGSWRTFFSLVELVGCRRSIHVRDACSFKLACTAILRAWRTNTNMKTSLAHFRMVLFFVTFVVLSTCLIYGQATQANLNGTVTDTSGASVPRARVEVVSPNTGFKRQVETGDAGVYSITGLPVGTYDLTISHEGFKTFEEKGIALFVGQTRTVNAQLEVGAAIQRVEVRATAQALENVQRRDSEASSNHDKWRTSPLTGGTGPSSWRSPRARSTWAAAARGTCDSSGEP